MSRVRGREMGEERREAGLKTLLLPKTWRWGRPIPRKGSGSGLRLPRRSLERLTALQVKGDTNNLKENWVQK